MEKSEFSKEQREKIVEMLLSQERVLALLYDKTFPNKPDEEKKSEEVKKELDEADREIVEGESENASINA